MSKQIATIRPAPSSLPWIKSIPKIGDGYVRVGSV